MADFAVGQENARAFLEVAGASISDADLTNPLGVVTSNLGVTQIDPSHYHCHIDPAYLTVQGVYTLAWGSTLENVQRFTVGPAGQKGVTRWSLRLQVAARQGEVWTGKVNEAQRGLITDHTLMTGPNLYGGAYVMLGINTGDYEMWGQTRRIRRGDGPTLTFSEDFLYIPTTGMDYALLRINPEEVDRALVLAAEEVATSGRVPLTVNGPALVKATDRDGNDYWQAPIPAGFVTVDTVWLADGREIDSEFWWMAPGRNVRVHPDLNMEAGEVLRMRGTRNFALPLWNHGICDGLPPALIPRAALELLATRAGGSIADPREHLRKQMMVTDEYQKQLSTHAGRIPHGSQDVLE